MLFAADPNPRRYYWLGGKPDFPVLFVCGVSLAMPRGLLWYEALRGLSAETIYNQIINDMRRYRRLSTLCGKGVGDILGGRAGWWQTAAGMSLDEFYCSALAEGLEYHQGYNRGYILAGLIEEIRALSQPPIPWDVKLARWFDTYFPPLEKRRTYARPSRRQASTPDIPRPSYVIYEEQQRERTFGVVLDTSGSMGRKLLAQALGAIASYSMACDVPILSAAAWSLAAVCTERRDVLCGRETNFA